MKLKPLTPFIIAITLFILMDCLINFTPLNDLLSRRVGNQLEVKLKELNTQYKYPIDVLAFGSSRINNGFATEAFEHSFPVPVKAYNLGLSSGDYFVFTLILDEYLKNHPKPKLILLDASDHLLNESEFSDNNILYFRALISRNPAVAMSLWSTPLLPQQIKNEILLTYVSGTYRYRSLLHPENLKTLLRPKNAQSIGQEQNKIGLKGWSPLTSQSRHLSSADNIRNYLVTRKRNYFDAYKKVNVDKLNYFLSYCKDNKIPVVMVEWPYHSEYQALYQSSDAYPMVKSALQKAASQYQVSFIDLSGYFQRERSGETEFYYDLRHLRASGAEEVSAHFAEDLLKVELAQKLFVTKPVIKNVVTSVPSLPLYSGEERLNPLFKAANPGKKAR